MKTNCLKRYCGQTPRVQRGRGRSKSRWVYRVEEDAGKLVVAIGWRMPSVEVAGDVCLRRPGPTEGCRTDDGNDDDDDDDLYNGRSVLIGIGTEPLYTGSSHRNYGLVPWILLVSRRLMLWKTWLCVDPRLQTVPLVCHSYLNTCTSGEPLVVNLLRGWRTSIGGTAAAL
jgi:hypothetical protein